MNESPKEPSASEKFWSAFKACVEENRVHHDRSSHYVRWARDFVRFLPGKKLRERSRQDISAFLSCRPGVSVISPADF